MASRTQHERRFPHWDELPDGGRQYTRTIKGKTAGYARYIKVVDVNELTLRIVQEIYDDQGNLMAIHQKYPVDTGHQDVGYDGDE